MSAFLDFEVDCGVCCFVCDYLRDLRETLGFRCADRLSKLACYSLADSADHAEECSKLHYFAEKDRLETLKYPLDMTVYDFL